MNHRVSPERTELAIPVALISDDPAEEDAFGSHGAVARAIFDLVRTEDGGRAIGVAGRFGSGKSTVVGLLARCFKESPDVTLWTFDAWAHDDDPLRRTFLESLIDILETKEWLDPSRCKRARDKLSGRRRRTKSKTSPRLSTLGSIVALATLLVPIGAILFSHGLGRGISLDTSQSMNAPFVIGLLLMLSPIATAIVGAFVDWRTRKQKDPKAKYDWSAATRLLSEERKVETTTTTFETTDPTSLEFERAFGFLLQEALCTGERRMIVVLDNLDRVGSRQALALWSTLQTFLRQRRERPEWFKRIWFIVPYDEVALSKLWRRDDEEGDLAGSFLDKSFQIVFRVPPPILSDWRSFFDSYVRTAFPVASEEDHNRIATIFALTRDRAGPPPTPRDIKVYLNQVGAFHRIHGESISLPIIAYYVSLRRKGTPVIQGLRDELLPEPTVAPYFSDEDAAAGLAAVEYGVEISSARQILLEEPIRLALEAGDPDRLQTAAHIGGDFIWPVLIQTVQRSAVEWQGGQTTRILLAYDALRRADFWEEAPTHAKRSVLQRLDSALELVEAWEPFDDRLAGPLAGYTQSRSQGVRVRLLAEIVQRSITAQFSEDEPDTDAIALVTSAFISAIDRSRGDSLPTFVLPAKVDVVPKILEGVDELDADVNDEIYFAFDLAGSDAQIIDLLVKEITTGATLGLFALVRSMARHRPNADWEKILSLCIERLQAKQGTDPVNVNATLGIARNLARSIGDESGIESLVRQGHLAHHVHGCREKNAEATCRLVVTILEFDPNLSPQQQVGQSAHGYQAIRQIAKNPNRQLLLCLGRLVHNYGLYDMVLDLRKKNPSLESFSGRVLRSSSKHPSFVTWISADIVVRNWGFLSEWIEKPRLLSAPRVSTELIERFATDLSPTEFASLVAWLIGNAERGAELIPQARSSLEALTSAEWQAAINDGSGILDLGSSLAQVVSDGFLEGELETALRRTAEALAENDSKTLPRASDVQVLPVLLSETYRNLLHHALWEIVLRSRGAVTAGVLSVFGTELVASDHMRTRNKPISDFVVPAIEAESAHGILWLAETAERGTRLFGGLDQPYRRQLQKALRAKIEGGTLSDELKDACTLILSSLEGE